MKSQISFAPSLRSCPIRKSTLSTDTAHRLLSLAQRALFVSVLCLWMAIGAPMALSQVPQTMSFQALLTGADGIPVSDGAYALTFRFYDTDTGGQPLWEETQQVEVAGGLFHVILGSATPLTLAFDQPYWVGVTIEGEELAPRLALTSAAYSLTARATVAEPENGQGFVVRDADGGTAHVLRPDGSVMHAGQGHFEGGLVVAGGAEPASDDTTQAVGKASGSQGLPEIGMNSRGSRVGVFGYSPNGQGVQGKSESGLGVFGVSENGTGVLGTSFRDFGVRGVSDQAAGVIGISESTQGVRGVGLETGVKGVALPSGSGNGVHGTAGEGIGVFGEADEGIGVFGVAESGVGAWGNSESNAGVRGTSDSGPGGEFIGDPAGLFHGNVEILGMLKIDEVEADPSEERILVWSDDHYVRYKILSDGGGGSSVWTDDGTTTRTTRKVEIRKDGGDRVYRFDPATESFAGGCTGSYDSDGSCTEASRYQFDDDEAEVNTDLSVQGSLVIRDEDGDEVFRVNPDGTSFHAGLEEFAAGLVVPVPGQDRKITLDEFGFRLPIGALGGVSIDSETGALEVSDGEGNTVFRVNPDGTSFHAGEEEFAGGLRVTGDGHGIAFPDGSLQTTAGGGSSGFTSDGNTTSTSLKVEFRNRIGLPILRFDPETGSIVIDVNGDGEGDFTIDRDKMLVKNKASFGADVEIGCTGPLRSDGSCTEEPVYTVKDNKVSVKGDLEVEGGLVVKDSEGKTGLEFECMTCAPGTIGIKVRTTFDPDGDGEGEVEIDADETRIKNKVSFGDDAIFSRDVGMGCRIPEPDGSCSPDEVIYHFDEEKFFIRNVAGEEVFRINADGTSFHAGLEEFAGGIAISGDGHAITFPDGTTQTTAATDGGFDGVLEDRPLIVKDSGGEEVFRVDPDGTSFHGGVEEFAAGLTVPVPGQDRQITLDEFGFRLPIGALGSVSIDSETGTLEMTDSDGTTVFRVEPDGTSFHAGEEEFAGGLTVPIPELGENQRITLDEFGIFVPFEGSGGITMSNDTGIDVTNADGTTVFRVNPDGTSFHAGLERFEEGLEVPGAEGGTIRLNELGLSVSISDAFGGGLMTVNPFGLLMLNGDGDTVFEVLPDGSSFHAGEEEFAGGLRITGDGHGITFPDGSLQTTAATDGGFDGVLEDTPFIVKDAAGNETFRVDPDGTSFHGGHEVFAGGLTNVDALHFENSLGDPRGGLFPLPPGSGPDLDVQGVWRFLQPPTLPGMDLRGSFNMYFNGAPIGGIAPILDPGSPFPLLSASGLWSFSDPLRALGGMTVGGDLNVEGTVQATQAIFQQWEAAFAALDQLLVEQATQLNGGLTVEGNGQFNNDVDVAGSLTVDNLTLTNELNVDGGDVVFNKNLQVVIDLLVGNDVTVGGNLDVTGTVSKGGGSFKIDHPLDPANRYLYHSFVESPDMMNVYNGNVILDARGEAWIDLPDWFEALNRDFRYQLTCIGGFAPVYVAEEVQDNRFKIAGGTPGLTISWQITGVRKDPFAETHRIPVEADKPAHQRGTYLYPDAYGQPQGRHAASGRDSH